MRGFVRDNYFWHFVSSNNTSSVASIHTSKHSSICWLLFNPFFWCGWFTGGISSTILFLLLQTMAHICLCEDQKQSIDGPTTFILVASVTCLHAGTIHRNTIFILSQVYCFLCYYSSCSFDFKTIILAFFLAFGQCKPLVLGRWLLSCGNLASLGRFLALFEKFLLSVALDGLLSGDDSTIGSNASLLRPKLQLDVSALRLI